MSDRESWLLIGGAGYIGSHVARELNAQGERVVVLDNLVTGIRSRVDHFAEFVHGDGCDSRLIVNIGKKYNVIGVINLAAYMQARESVSNPIKYWRNNLGVSLALADAISSLNLRRVILSSSCSVYGNVFNATEEDRLNPVSPYAQTKVASEQILKQICNETNTDFISLRYFNVIGGGDFPDSIDTKDETLVPSVSRKILQNEPPVIFGSNLPTRDGTCERDYIDVRDLATAHAIVCDLNANVGKNFINVSTGKVITVLEVVNELLKASKSNLKPIMQDMKLGDPISVSALPSTRLLEMGWRPSVEFSTSISNHWNALENHL